MSDTPDPLKDWEPTKPFVPDWLDTLVQAVCDHPVLVAIGVIMIALGFATL